MRPIALLRTFFVLALIASIASALAAIVARGRMTSHGGPADDELDLVAIFEGMELASTAPALRRASVTTWYGGGRLDRRDAGSGRCRNCCPRGLRRLPPRRPADMARRDARDRHLRWIRRCPEPGSRRPGGSASHDQGLCALRGRRHRVRGTRSRPR